LVYFEKHGKYPINKESLRGIFFGCKTPLAEAKEVVKICADAGYKDLEYYKMLENESEYKLDKRRLQF
jgi:hypothetical protein